MSKLEIYHENAHLYDIFELNDGNSSVETNKKLISYLKEHSVKTVLDMTCGTGAQCIELENQGFGVTASDLSEEMIAIAKTKASKTSIEFHIADMQSVSLGKFDAIFTLFNSVGHLDKQGLQETVNNAFNHLNEEGILIFDIFNRDLMKILPSYPFIDKAMEHQSTHLVRYTQFSFDEDNGYLSIKQNSQIQTGLSAPKEINREFKLLTYKKKELVEIVENSGFELIEVAAHGLSDFYSVKSPIIDQLMHFVIARKPKSN